jgi:hypothetical protein
MAGSASRNSPRSTFGKPRAPLMKARTHFQPRQDLLRRLLLHREHLKAHALCCVQTFSGTHHRRRVCGGDTRHFPGRSIWACFQSICRCLQCISLCCRAEYFSMHGGPTAIITLLCARKAQLPRIKRHVCYPVYFFYTTPSEFRRPLLYFFHHVPIVLSLQFQPFYLLSALAPSCAHGSRKTSLMTIDVVV